MIDGADIARLNHHQFRKIINTLLTVEANENRVRLDDLELNTRDTDPDAGVDARVRWPESAPHDVFAAGEIVVQFKSGKLTERDLSTELGKRGVRQTLLRGGNYLLLVGHDYVPATRDKRREQLARICKRTRLPISRCRILYGDQIGRWISNYPAVAILPELGKPIPAFATVERWKQDSVFQNAFHADASREAVIKAVRAFVSPTENQENIIRVEGPAGVGKTRLALEALSERGIAESVIYAPNAEAPQVQELLAWMQGYTSARAIVVVDECNHDQQEVLARYARLCGPRLRLICVGPTEMILESPPGLEQVYRLAPLPDADMKAVLIAAEQGIPTEIVDTSVRVSGGYVKLALYVARVLVKQHIPLVELRTIQGVRQILKKFVSKEISQSLQALSLLARVGWEDEVRQEAQALASAVDLKFKDLQKAVRELKQQGVVLPRGRYLYVSPDLLAINAAAELWDERGADLVEIVTALPGSEPRRQFLIRLVTMSQHNEVRKAVERLLSLEGLFRTIEDIDQPFLSEVFRILCAALPQAALDRIATLLAGTPRSRLLSFSSGRRNVIWALESLLRWPETSIKAARCIRELALAENESITNSATGVFQQYFQVFLSGSPIPFEDRLQLLDDLVGSEDANDRQLALKGAAAALQQHEYRMGGDSDPISHRGYPSEWRPRTIEDLQNARLSALRRLRTLAAGSDQTAGAARSELIRSVYTLARNGMIEDAIRVLDSVQPQADQDRRDRAEAAGWVLRHHANLSGPQRLELARLLEATYGEDFESQLKRWVGPRLHADYDLAGGTGFADADSTAVRLAESGHARGIGDAELKWLCSPEALNVWPFGKRLGELDTEQHYLQRIVEFSPDDGNSMLLNSYLLGLRSKVGDAVCERIVDSLAENRPVLAFAATLRGPNSETAGRRVLELMESGRVPPFMLQALMYGGWVASLPLRQQHDIIRGLLSAADEALAAAAISILHHSRETDPNSADRLADLAWEALERPLPVSRFETDWEWGEIAKSLARNNPKRVALLTIGKMVDESSWLRFQEIGRDVLSVATQADWKETWEVVSATLLETRSCSYRILLGLEHWYGNLLPTEELTGWARASSRRRSIAVRLIPVAGVPMPERLRALLKAFPADDEIYDSVLADLGSGSWMGPYSGHLRQEQDVLRNWATQEDDPHIREWAASAVQRAGRAIARQSKLEEEEAVF